MGSARNRVNNIIEYLESLNIDVNVAKNKARGNKGFFAVRGKKFRIDVSQKIDDESVLGVLAHEFAHYFHYCNDKTLSSLDFIFDNYDDNILEELISITVDSISRDSIKPFFDKKKSLKSEIKFLANEISKFPKVNDFDKIEKNIMKTPLKYLLKYDKVKVLDGFKTVFYSIEDLDNTNPLHIYLKLKSKKRALNRVNSKINRLNKYYNSPTELFARSFECYVTNKSFLREKAPTVYQVYEQVCLSDKFPILTNFVNKM